MDLLFFLAGIVLLFKKQVKVTAKKQISGRPLKILAFLYILPSTSSFILGIMFGPAIFDQFSWLLKVPFSLVILAMLVTLYFIFFSSLRTDAETNEHNDRKRRIFMTGIIFWVAMLFLVPTILIFQNSGWDSFLAFLKVFTVLWVIIGIASYFIWRVFRSV